MADTITEAKDGNQWMSLAADHGGILIDVVAKYLKVDDVVNLMAVSKDYNQALTSPHVNKMLAVKLQKEAEFHHTVTGKLLYTEQLPTIGYLSVKESLEADALLVAKLRTAASRRRGLLLLPENQDIKSADGTLYHYRKKYLPESRQNNNSFVCVNLSGENIYCRPIDGGGRPYSSRRYQIRPFTENASFNFILSRDGPAWQSYALSHKRTGAPFAIYQLRRAWIPTSCLNENNNGRITHTHAIAVLPGGEVREIHCNTFQFRARKKLLCRHTGLEVAQEGLRKYFDESENNNRTDNLDSAKELTKEFYGLQVPHYQDPLWRKVRNAAAQTIANPWYSFNSTKASVEAVWYEAINPWEEAVSYQSTNRFESTYDDDPEYQERWDLVRVIPGDEQNDFQQCSEGGCNDRAVASWTSNVASEDVWHCCQACQERFVGGWPDYAHRLGLKTKCI